jgi:hypothetical protein
VEIEDVELSNVFTPFEDGVAGNSAFADYRSLSTDEWDDGMVWTEGAEYGSECMNTHDRVFAHLPYDDVMGSCDVFDPDTPKCNCSDQSQNQSLLYTGMMNVAGPFQMEWHTNDTYPDFGVNSMFVGHWYSHPVGGRCALGSAVGDGGCTWQRAAHAYALDSQVFVDAGMRTHQDGWGILPNTSVQKPAMWKHNLEVFQSVWEEANLPACGASTQTTFWDDGPMVTLTFVGVTVVVFALAVGARTAFS